MMMDTNKVVISFDYMDPLFVIELPMDAPVVVCSDVVF